jgi:hypothetical protein
MVDTIITAQTVVDNSIARIKDPDKTRWSDATMLIPLNKACAYTNILLIRLKSDLAKTTSTIAMVASTQEYSLSTYLPDFYAMSDRGVYYATVGTPLTPVTVEDKIRCAGATTASMPGCYYVTDSDVGLIDIPNATSVAAYPTLTCKYYKKSAPLALGDTMPYKNIFNEPISTFMDHMIMVSAEALSEEYTAIYNTLEESVIDIVKNRTAM